MPRTHDRTDFFKLATFDIAKIVIEHRTIRWRTPLQFNDPFDTQTRLTATVDEDEFADRFVERVSELAFANPLPPFFDADSKLHEMAMVMRRIADQEGRDDSLARIRESAIDIARTLPESLRKFSLDVAAHMQHGRVFCMTEKINNVVMWSHYADEHKGVGFKLRVLDEVDHPFLVAKPVEYSDEYVNAGNAIQLADHFTRAAPIDMTALLWRLVYLKHSDWAYEKEWRCYYPLLGEPVGTGFRDAVQVPELFESIYLGCCMDEDHAAEIVALAHRFLPATTIYRATKSESSFDLEFVPI